VIERTSGGAAVHQVSYVYDALDRRITQTIDGTTTYTVYDGENAWADFTSTGVMKARYLFGLNTDEPLARFKTGEGTTWYLSDRLGTVRDLADNTGNVVDTITYDSFGSLTSETNAARGDRYKFAGREYEPTTGLYYNRDRYYDPKMGRFLSEDSFGFGAGDVNLSRYVGNSPSNGTDPTGNFAIAESIAAYIPGFTVLNQLLHMGGDGTFTMQVGSKSGHPFFGAGGDFNLEYDKWKLARADSVPRL